MSSHRYLNGDHFAGEDNTQAIIRIDRSSPVVRSDEDGLVSVERFTLQAFLPLFDASSAGTIIIEDVDGNQVSQVVDWTPKAVDGYVYNYRHVAEAMSIAINTACDDTGIGADDIPTMTYNDKTSDFSITSTAAFRGSYKILFDSALYRFFNSFDFETQQTTYELLLNEDIETQRTPTLEYLSPVKRIVIQSTMSVQEEYLPNPTGAQNIVSNFDGSFLVDYSFFAPNGNPMQYIYFSASDADHRWHNLVRGANVQNVVMYFKWFDTNNNGHLIKMKKGCSVTCKLYFLVD